LKVTHFGDIDTLTPNDFEYFIKDLFLVCGWNDAEVTKIGKDFKHGDGGVDIFAWRAGRKYAIEVKQRHIKSNVDTSALNQLVTGAKYGNAKHLILVTNSYFTTEVITRSLRLGVELIDRDKLQNMWVEQSSEIGRSTVTPRKYQLAVIEEVKKEIQKGKSKLLIEMATGLGKTYTAAWLIKHIFNENKSPKKVLFVAHQVEILLQSITSFKNVFGVGNYSFSICFGGLPPEETDFVFACFDTLLIHLKDLPENKFDLIIVDEAHHTPAVTYQKVTEYFKPELLIGLTATPFRLDNKDVLAHFGGADGHIGKYDLVWGLKHRKLAFPKYHVLLDDLDQSKINQIDSGLSIKDLDSYLFLHKKEDEVIRIIERTIKDNEISPVKGIVFCKSLSHIKYLIQFFKVGSATFVHSKLSDPIRREHIRKYREDSDCQFILVCDLFNEGIDVPETNLLVFLRQTASRNIWLQQLGRGLRKTANKDYVDVLDFVGSLERIQEIRNFSDSITKSTLNPEFLDEPNDESEPKPRKEHHHDSSIEINYSESAAQVLKLIESQKYRLNTRSEAIIALRDNWELNFSIPAIEEIADLSSKISLDQIATHFDSYFGYTSSALPEEISTHQNFKGNILEWSQNFLIKNKLLPSYRSIVIHFKHECLPYITEKELIGILGKEGSFQIEIHQDSAIRHEESAPKIQVIENISHDEPSQNVLIKKHVQRISNMTDLKKLSDEEIQEIKSEFGSIFHFFKLLQQGKV